MQSLKSFLLILFSVVVSGEESEEPALYYYGLEVSERSLPACAPRQACSAFIQRFWRPAAIVRLCRCPRRAPCDTRAGDTRTIPWNNRAHFQFCRPVSDWPECSFGESPLTVEASYERINPDELERLHHKNIQLHPPKIVFSCKCPEPNYWKLDSSVESESVQVYQCYSLPVCNTGEFCGNVNYDLNALYQSCMCPKHHMCVHNGGVTHLYITELLYRGKGWKAYCQRISEDYSYDDY